MSAVAAPEARTEGARLCVSCWLALAAVLAVVGASFAWLAVDFSVLFTADALSRIAAYVRLLFPPDTSAVFLHKTALATVETIAISAMGTLLAVIAGAALALPASGRHGAGARAAARLMLNALRSVPELVWAALMVLFAGLGPFAGTLALAAHTTGVLGRLFGETLENAPPAPALSLVDGGARPSLAFMYGTLPAIVPQLIAYSLYRWEMNVRMATVLGFVGAGGLGELLYYEFSLLHERRACTVILAMLAVVVLIDGLSARVRRGLAEAGA
jgi:phosphonate transport system permease protein